MRIYTKAGDLSFSTFTFPDGQPHLRLETYEREFSCVTIETAIKSPLDLFQVVLACDVLRQHGFAEVLLDIRYLLGARMDRAISALEPFTLQTVARIINSCGFSKVRILDVHSEVATRLIRNSVNVLPFSIVDGIRTTLGYPEIVCPDKGAIPRVVALTHEGRFIRCSKIRDMSTGNLTGFKVDQMPGSKDPYSSVLILDDICDGGGTFVGLAKELRKAGAKKVYLYITHGIFSKGLKVLEEGGIDGVYTTNSYESRETFASGYCENMPKVIIPISMKELP